MSNHVTIENVSFAFPEKKIHPCSPMCRFRFNKENLSRSSAPADQVKAHSSSCSQACTSQPLAPSILLMYRKDNGSDESPICRRKTCCYPGVPSWRTACCLPSWHQADRTRTNYEPISSLDWQGLACPVMSRPIRMSYPAACGSGWHCCVPCLQAGGSCCWMNPSVHSTL